MNKANKEAFEEALKEEIKRGARELTPQEKEDLLPIQQAILRGGFNKKEGQCATIH